MILIIIEIKDEIQLMIKYGIQYIDNKWWNRTNYQISIRTIIITSMLGCKEVWV